jgi:hypothetical protein
LCVASIRQTSWTMYQARSKTGRPCVATPSRARSACRRRGRCGRL